METFAKVLGLFTLALLYLTIIALLIGLPVMWMVNYLVAPSALFAVFGIYQLTFWKAFWLSILTGTFFYRGNSGSNKKEK
jgi:hypothetical protein